MVFWKSSNNEEIKRMSDFYPKGVKKDFCTVPNFETLKENTIIDLGFCGNTRWSFGIEKKNDNVSIGLNCEPAEKCLASSLNWSVHADVTIHFVNHKGMEKWLTTSGFDVTFDRVDKGHNWKHTFEKCVPTEKNGFLTDGSVLFQIHIGIAKIDELYSGDFIDFSVPREGESDVILVVDKKKLHVSKQILSINSPFFQALFNGNFNESSMSEIPLNNVDFNSFHIFLQYIYMAPIHICAENVSQLLMLGDQFVARKLKRECENFLMRKDIDEKDAIELAVFHSLDRLLCHKIQEKGIEELAIWWSTNPAIQGTPLNLLKEKLNISVETVENSLPKLDDEKVSKSSSSENTDSESSSTSSDSESETDSDSDA